jgi:hypothetical protein
VFYECWGTCLGRLADFWNFRESQDAVSGPGSEPKIAIDKKSLSNDLQHEGLSEYHLASINIPGKLLSTDN